ncbi:MAG: hypothetical protein NTX01_01955, partial [Candidatus Omnitrophica bacterium]|nr:hypothetical protein [Candidatus Omnitrophota bacterium]
GGSISGIAIVKIENNAKINSGVKTLSKIAKALEVILVKDKRGKVIGFEKLNFFLHPKEIIKTIPVEVLVS